MVHLFKNSRTDKFYAYYTDIKSHKRVQFSCKTSNKKIAEKFADAEYRKRCSQLIPTTGISLKNFANHYVETLEGVLSPRTIEAYRDSFNQFIKRLGDIPLSTIDVRICQDFIYNNQPSKETGARHYRTLRRAFKVSIQWGYILENP